MISVQKVIFPGIALGCIFIVMVTSLISAPGRTLAVSAQAIVEPAAPDVLPEQQQPAQLVAEVAEQVQEILATAQAAPEVPAVEETAPPEVAAAAAEEAAAEAETPQVEAQPAENPADQPEEECTVSPSYPENIRRWCDLIQRYGSQYGVEPNLIAAVMLQESSGNPDAYSKSGAVGLMQVMPRDGLAAGFMCVNGPCFSSRPSMDELFDPEFNVDYGVRMLAALIQKYGGVRDALKAYGPMNYGYRYADIILNIMANHP